MDIASDHEILCPVCGTRAPRETSFRDIVLHRCPACDHCFTDVSSLEHLGEYDEAWEALHPNWFANPNLSLFEFVSRTVEQHKPDAAVIDIGAGRGELLAHLHAHNPRFVLTGLDVSLRPEVEGAEFVAGDVATVNLGERRWDAAVSLATIEHVDDVQAFASRVAGILVPGGIAIVMTIDDRSVLYAAARFLRRVGYSMAFERLYDRFHLNHFNSRSLRTLMERSGFETLEHRHHNIPIRAVDMPRDSGLLRAGVWTTFALGKLTRRTYEQTIVCRKRSTSGATTPAVV